MHIELYGYLNTLFKYILDQNNVYFNNNLIFDTYKKGAFLIAIILIV